jgi:hypothetical protein
MDVGDCCPSEAIASAYNRFGLLTQVYITRFACAGLIAK